MEKTEQIYRLRHRGHPYVSAMENFGPGTGRPYPNFSMLAVGYTRNPKNPGNLEIINPDKYGFPDGGKWRIVTVWGTGWMAIQSLITGELIFSVPPGTLEPIARDCNDSNR